MALQDLYVSCKEVFKGPGTVPLHQDVKRLCHMLGMFLNLTVKILLPFLS